MCFLVFFMTYHVIPQKVADRPHFAPIQESHTM